MERKMKEAGNKATRTQARENPRPTDRHWHSFSSSKRERRERACVRRRRRRKRSESECRDWEGGRESQSESGIFIRSMNEGSGGGENCTGIRIALLSVTKFVGVSDRFGDYLSLYCANHLPCISRRKTQNSSHTHTHTHTLS